MGFRFSTKHEDAKIRNIMQEIQDNFVSKDKNGNVDLGSGSIKAKDAYLESDSLYLGKVKFKSPKASEDSYYMKANVSSGKKEIEYVDTATPTTEEVQDIVGAMLTGNTETLIAVTYQDADGTIDFVVDEANIDHDALTNFVANEHLPGIDEDNMVSDSDAHVPTQQSVKAYADSIKDCDVHTSGSTNFVLVRQAAEADLNQTISDPPTQAEVQAISDKIDALLAKLRSANVIAT